MRFIQEKNQSVEIATLTMGTGLIKKHNQVMENTTYLVLLSTNWGTRWGCTTPMKKIL